MADPTTAPENSAAEPNINPSQLEPDKQISQEPAQINPPSTASVPPPNPNPSTPPSILGPPTPSIQPSFRPAAPPPTLGTPQFTPVPSVNYQTPGVPPPGVSAVTPRALPLASATGGAVASVPMGMSPYGVPSQPMRPYAPMPNGYPGIPQPVPPGAMPPPVFS